MSGINLAECTGTERLLFSGMDETCVFISYKSQDVEAAKAINEYLNNIANINTYFDINDAKLKKATTISNDEGIVKSIKCGLDMCTHLICLISDETRISWWVPYEIGYADCKDKQVASLKLKDVKDIPSFLKVKDTLYNIEDLLRYLSTVSKYKTLFEASNYQRLISQDTSLLEEYIDKGD